MRETTKNKLRQLRKWRIRKKIAGSPERPRMSVFFSNTHIYVQFIDDQAGKTVASISTRNKAVPDREAMRANVASAKKLGTLAAEAAKAKGISAVIFDRNGRQFHGKVKALADAAREAGLKF